MNLELLPTAGDLTAIRAIWEALEKENPPSYFLSWGWIETWLSSLPERSRPELVLFGDKGDPQIAFFLGRTVLVRKHLFRSRGWFLNATGVPAFDRLYIEYNGFLCKSPGRFSLKEVVQSLPGSWDELFFPGLDAGSFPGTSLLDAIHPYRTIVDDDLVSPYVDLEMVRAAGGDVLPLLSANTRSQMNRSLRWCEKNAPLDIEAAPDTAGAIEIYDELVAYHQASWAERRREGAFSSDYMLRFHRELIWRRFQHGEIQLLRIKAGGQTLGCLYNFLYNRKVYFYQSGMNYHLDRRLKPGMVAHLLAIRHNAAAGRSVYDFLAGGSRYKMSLATHHNRLIWLRVQKPLWRFKIENALKTCKHFLTVPRKRNEMPRSGPLKKRMIQPRSTKGSDRVKEEHQW